MGQYFKPWRRKLGVATLALAFVFIAGWLRSQTRHDGVEIWSGKHKYSIRSQRGCIRWDQMFVPDGELEESVAKPYSDSLKNQNDSSWTPVDATVRQIRWEYVAGDFSLSKRAGMLEFGSLFVPNPGLPKRFTMYIAMIPYWVVVALLMPLSAWLLLSKPKPKPAETETILES